MFKVSYKVHSDNFPRSWDHFVQQIKFVWLIFVEGQIVTISVQLIGILISGIVRGEYSLSFRLIVASCSNSFLGTRQMLMHEKKTCVIPIINPLNIALAKIMVLTISINRANHLTL